MRSLALSSAKFAAVGVVLAGGLTFADEPRSLKWLYPTDNVDFATAANWGWVDSAKTEAIASAPGADDSVTFSATAADQPDILARSMSLSDDTTISNFTFAASRGAFTVDLGSKTLSVRGLMDLSLDRTVVGRDSIAFKDGTISVLKGGRLCANPNTWAYRGVNLTFDNMTVDCLSGSTPTFNIYSTGVEGGDYARTNRIVLANNSEIKANLMRFNVANQNAPCCAEIEVQDSKMTVYDETKVGTATLNALWFTSSDRLSACFKGDSSLDTGMLVVNGAGTSLSLEGGSHTLRYAENYGENGSLRLFRGSLAVTNGATLSIVKGDTKIFGGATLSVRDGGAFTSGGPVGVGTAINGALGVAINYSPSTVVVGNGSFSSSTITFGSSEAFSNNVLRVAGAQGRIETTADWTLINLNFGAKVAFEIPADGYHDAAGNARAPVYAKGIFNSTTTDNCRPISLELKTKAFDKANPKKSVVLMSSYLASMTMDSKAYYTKDVFETLTNNVVFVDSARNPGTLSISADGKSLIYTAPTPTGMAVIVR